MTDNDVMSPIDKPWSLASENILDRLSVSKDRGLSDQEIDRRRLKFGRNTLREAERKSFRQILFDQFKNLIIVLLAVAAVLSFLFGENVEGLAIIAVILINAAIGFFTEIKAVRSMESLRKLGSVDAIVRRDGKSQKIPAEEIVPGDIILFEGGDVITADIRLIEASRLEVDESALTGESVPVGKENKTVDEDSPIAERTGMLFKGTSVSRGSGEGVAVATGMNTELGRISSLVEEAEQESTPLEERLDRLGHNLIWVTLVLTAVIAILGVLKGSKIFLMIETAIALAVAAIPEGLPIVATIALARGMLRMARRNALINRLASVETLGTTNVVCTDKTGTLTENRMTVSILRLPEGNIVIDGDTFYLEQDGNREKFEPREDSGLEAILTTGVLCNNAVFNKKDNGNAHIGDPMELALLAAGEKAGLDKKSLIKKMPEEREEAFDSETKKMATYHRSDGKLFVAVKGAPEEVLNVCTKVGSEKGRTEVMTERIRDRWRKTNEEMASEGMRVLALASKEADSTGEKPYEGLTFLGMMGLLDPAREDVRESIALCHKAGIRVIMVTGDQPLTARNIAATVGIADDEKEIEIINGRELKKYDEMSDTDKDTAIKAQIFARVSPRQKLDIITLHQKRNSIVAMTGDGVNDAPALKKADIGIAMGRRGTQVAREAADMVLKDDAFSSIVAAVRQGRIIFDNIRKFVFYLLSCNVSEILAVGVASTVDIPLPILPLQILFLNLVTDVFPALALGVGEGNKEIMNHPPRGAAEPIITRRQWGLIGGYGIIIAGCVLAALAVSVHWLEIDREQAVTISFLTLALAQLWHVFNMRAAGTGIFINEITRNKYVWGALMLCVALILIAVYVPGLSHIMKLESPGRIGWSVAIGFSLVPLVIGQIMKLIKVDES